MKLILCSGDVEVVEINNTTKTIIMLITIDISDKKMSREQIDSELVTPKRIAACIYMLEEGFIPDDLREWTTQVGVISRNKQIK